VCYDSEREIKWQFRWLIAIEIRSITQPFFYKNSKTKYMKKFKEELDKIDKSLLESTEELTAEEEEALFYCP
jgi:hypothetical protein